jgi:hypothetical protein
LIALLTAYLLVAAPVKPIVPLKGTALTKSNHGPAVTIFCLGEIIRLRGKPERWKGLILQRQEIPISNNATCTSANVAHANMQRFSPATTAVEHAKEKEHIAQTRFQSNRTGLQNLF